MHLRNRLYIILPQSEPIPAILETIEMLDEHTVLIKYKDNVQITAKGINDAFELLYKVTNNQKAARLVVIGKDDVITNAGRLEIAEENKRHKDLIIAEAIVVHAFYQKIKTNFYLSIIKKVYPVQCFTDIDLAKAWLATQIASRV